MLDDLERDVGSTRDRVDWVAKKFLLTALRNEEQLDWSDPWLQSVDLEYHNVDPDIGLFHALEGQGAMRRLVADDNIAAAALFPPETTRAYFRGRSVAKYGTSVSSVQWDEVVFTDNGRPRRVALPEVFDDARLERLNALCQQDLPAAEFIESAARS
jgi:proteasome accessory factor A